MNSLDTPRKPVEAPALLGLAAAPPVAPTAAARTAADPTVAARTAAAPQAAARTAAARTAADPQAAARQAAGLPAASPGREPRGRHFEAEIRRWMLDLAGEGQAPGRLAEPRRVGGLVSRNGAARREHVAGPRRRARRALCA